MSSLFTAHEKKIIALMALVQFVNILDFVMVMPLGPDFSLELGIAESNLGLVAGSYTLAAAVAGLCGMLFLDNFDRKVGLCVATVGLSLGTLMGAFAFNETTLIMARFVAGFFGGPATSLALSIIADTVGNEKRGRAMGFVMMAFSIASVLGLPMGLTLAEKMSWRAPFVSVAALAFVVAALVWVLLPSMRGHIEGGDRKHVGELLREVGALLSRPTVQLSYAMTFVTVFGMFAIIPNISAYIQRNLGFPRTDVDDLYLYGGCVAFLTTMGAGFLVDKWGGFVVSLVGTVCAMIVVYFGFVNHHPWLPVSVIFMSFMFSTSLRNVSFRTVSSKVPGANERGRFQSLESAVQHIGMSAGAMMATLFLSSTASGMLLGIDRVATFTLCMMAMTPLLLRMVEIRLKRSTSGA